MKAVAVLATCVALLAGCVSADQRVLAYAAAQHACLDGRTSITHHRIGEPRWELDVCGTPRRYVESAGSFRETTPAVAEERRERAATTTAPMPPPAIAATATLDDLITQAAAENGCAETEVRVSSEHTQAPSTPPGAYWLFVCGWTLRFYQVGADGRWHEDHYAAQVVSAPPPVAAPPLEDLGPASADSPPVIGSPHVRHAEPRATTPSTGDVQVHGYYRRDGTYVHGYSRRRPH